MTCSKRVLIKLEADFEGLPETKAVDICQSYNFSFGRFHCLIMKSGESRAASFSFSVNADLVNSERYSTWRLYLPRAAR